MVLSRSGPQPRVTRSGSSPNIRRSPREGDATRPEVALLWSVLSVGGEMRRPWVSGPSRNASTLSLLVQPVAPQQRRSLGGKAVEAVAGGCRRIGRSSIAVVVLLLGFLGGRWAQDCQRPQGRGIAP